MGPAVPKCALIVGNGERPSAELFAELIVGEPLLLCADGGANTVAEFGRVPDLVVGDLDSVADSVRGHLSAARIVRIDADNTGTDLQKTLHYAKELGVEAATLTGVTGGRSDHLLWNLGLLKVFAADMALRIVDDYCEIRLVRDVLRFRAPLGQKVSLSPLGGAVAGIETRGLKFALHGETLEWGVRDGISNEVVDNPVEVRVQTGDLLLIIQREEQLGAVKWESHFF
ncbi:MAG: thiamine pyrophosphokinase [Candidatus Latescibacterota bacterium]|jgi:thiamine pyrophosphokinase